MAKTLSEFTITNEGENYLINLSTDDGETLAVEASYEQLDLMVEAIEETLDEDEESKLAVESAA